VPDRRKHRGPAPEDLVLFGVESRPVLSSAASDFSWLLSRGYAEDSALKLVGDRYQLAARQRVAVLRAACSDNALADRRSREIAMSLLPDRTLWIDGFNLIVTLELALGGGVVLSCRDGCYRDLASVHGTYRRVEETRPALELVSRWLKEWGIGPCRWLLDAPVSNSGRLAAMIRATDPSWSAEVVPNPDAILIASGKVVATADAGILDRCGHWINLGRALIEAGIPDALIVEVS
jgi:hypothetical protein